MVGDGFDEDTLIAVTTAGHAHRIAPETALRREVCPGGAVDAALHPDGTELLVVCGAGSPQLGARVPVGSLQAFPLEGASGGRTGASFSPDGSWYTTGAAGQGDPLLLWDSRTNQPVASLGDAAIRSLSWEDSGDQVLTVGYDGSAWLWSVPHLKQARGL